MDIIYQTVQLNLSEFKVLKIKPMHVGKYDKMDPRTRKKLVEFYKPFNRDLEKLLNRDFGWDK